MHLHAEQLVIVLLIHRGSPLRNLYLVTRAGDGNILETGERGTRRKISIEIPITFLYFLDNFQGPKLVNVLSRHLRTVRYEFMNVKYRLWDLMG